MSVETRPRSSGDGGRGERPYRRYGAYTAGANALRIDHAIDVDDDEELEVRTAGTAPARPRTTKPQPARTPRPRRRTEWVRDVTPDPVAPDAPALPVNLPKAPFVLLMVGLIVAGVVGVLVLQTKINEGSFRLSDLRATQAALDQREQQLEQQLDELSSPNNLRAAATRLGLVPAGDPAYLYLPDGRLIGLPQPAGR